MSNALEELQQLIEAYDEEYARVRRSNLPILSWTREPTGLWFSEERWEAWKGLKSKLLEILAKAMLEGRTDAH